MTSRAFNTKREAERRRLELRTTLILTLPEGELVEFMTAAKPPSLSDLVRLAKHRAAQKGGMCALCGQSLPIEAPRNPENPRNLPADPKPFTPPRARARENT